mmetsp:Transcript_25403/g.64431  ORF Transcript_25403/g.64431 Transcript_25403/m.64431 type:complete len:287 (+) Transcript_25403:47-907(+)
MEAPETSLQTKKRKEQLNMRGRPWHMLANRSRSVILLLISRTIRGVITTYVLCGTMFKCRPPPTRYSERVPARGIPSLHPSDPSGIIILVVLHGEDDLDIAPLPAEVGLNARGGPRELSLDLHRAAVVGQLALEVKVLKHGLVLRAGVGTRHGVHVHHRVVSLDLLVSLRSSLGYTDLHVGRLAIALPLGLEHVGGQASGHARKGIGDGAPSVVAGAHVRDGSPAGSHTHRSVGPHEVSRGDGRGAAREDVGRNAGLSRQRVLEPHLDVRVGRSGQGPAGLEAERA